MAISEILPRSTDDTGLSPEDRVTITGDTGLSPEDHVTITGDMNSSSEGTDLARPERIVLMAREGPLVIDVFLTIAGKTPDERFDELLTEILSQVTSHDESVIHWDELLKDNNLDYGLLGNRSLGNLNTLTDAERVQLTRMYDANGDGLVDRGELARFLTRNSDGSQAFSLRTTNFYYDIHRHRSPLLMILDENKDGVLDATEIASATDRLKRYDMNGNGMLLADEFRFGEDDSPLPLTQRRPNLPAPIVSLGQLRDWRQFLLELEAVYALGQPITSHDLPRQLKRFSMLDENGDGHWHPDEMKSWLEIEPDIELAIHFERSVTPVNELPSDAPRDGTTTLDELPEPIVDSESAAVVQQDDIRWATAARDATLPAIEVLSISNDLRESIKELSVLSDRLVLIVPGLILTIQSRDVDSQLVGQSTQAALRQIRARAGNDRDALFSMLDQNHDGRLTDREIATVAARLQEFDRNGNGKLELDEVPEVFLFEFARGAIQNAPAMSPVVSLPKPHDGVAPNWFTAMDRNQDGELSRREFPGTDELFRRLDQNGDGFLELRELEGYRP